jgi:hypothetical protein
MNARASADAEFYREYVKVFHMIAPPSALLNPRMLTSMLLGSKTPLYHGPAVRKIKSASASAHARSALSQP